MRSKETIPSPLHRVGRPRRRLLRHRLKRTKKTGFLWLTGGRRWRIEMGVWGGLLW